MKKRYNGNLPGKNAMRLLKLGLPLISAVLVLLSIELYTTAQASPDLVLVTYPDMFSHVLASLLLLVFAALIFDIIELG